MRSIRLIKEKEKLKKALKYLAEKKSDQQENLLGMCIFLWEELRTRERKEVDSTLRDVSPQDVGEVESV